jgi:hypothetical protein
MPYPFLWYLGSCQNPGAFNTRIHYIPSWSGALGDANRDATWSFDEAPWGHTLRYVSFAQFAPSRPFFFFFFSLFKQWHTFVFYPGTHETYAYHDGSRLAT